MRFTIYDGLFKSAMQEGSGEGALFYPKCPRPGWSGLFELLCWNEVEAQSE
jgi:hypothetical protein